MDKLRLRFEKTGKAAYISHLDLLHVVQRIFLRAGTPLKYSEGFNPHALISICVPLSVGTESVCELMDFRVTRDIDLAALPQQLNSVSPEGIRFIECYEQQRKAAEIKWLRVEGVYEYDSLSASDALCALEAFYSRESIPVKRRTKRGEGVLELAGNARGLDFEAVDGGVKVTCTVSAQEPTVNPDLLVRALEQLSPEYREILLLREINGLSYDEIGRALGLEEGTVKSRIFRARKELSEFLIREGNIPGSLASNERKGGANA